MPIKTRLTLLNFFQFFIWGSWLITIGNYWFMNKGWAPEHFGAIFATMGMSSLIMPTVTGIIADRWMRAERLYALLHTLGAIAFFALTRVDTPSAFFVVMLLAMLCYMPTIALMNAISYSLLHRHHMPIIKVFPQIRVWGTIGFIIAMWFINLSGYKASEQQFYTAGIAAVVVALYALTLPAIPPQHKRSGQASLLQRLGLDAFKLLKSYKMAVFFIFAMFLGAALQLTNMYGDPFLSHFKQMPEYADALLVRYSTIVMSLSQISEALFILSIPFFLKRFGIKRIITFSIMAWVMRFALFIWGDPGAHMWMIILSMIIYGLAFDFFNISGSLFVEQETDASMRASAQGLFMMFTNGFGAISGALISGWAIGKYFSNAEGQINNWPGIWLSFTIYALVVLLGFLIFFKHKHVSEHVLNND